MTGARLLRMASILLGAPVTNSTAIARSQRADDVDRRTLELWVAEEAGKRGLCLDEEYVARMVRIARKPPAVKTPRECRLAVVCCYFNPAGWQSLRANYLRFRRLIAEFDLPVFAAEVAYPGQDFPTPDAYMQIRAGRQNVMWQKERMINLLAESLPPDYEAIAWVDADMIFLDPEWGTRAVGALSRAPVVQLWNRCHSYNKKGSLNEVLHCVGENACRYLGGEPNCPGGAWAAQRSVFPIYDRHICGSGDATTLEGWTNLVNPKCLGKMNAAMQEDFRRWAEPAYAKVLGRIAVLPGDVVHMYHGKRANRQYVERWRPLIDGGFDPSQHICKDSNGLYAWTQEAPRQIVEWVANYFRQRQEDD